jgi:hypothetical protein
LEVERSGFFFEPFYALEPEFKFILVDTLFDEILSVAEHPINQASEVVSHGNDRFGLGAPSLALRRRYFAPSALLL